MTGTREPLALLPVDDKTERRMVLLQWSIMPLVLAGCLLPPPRPHDPQIHVVLAGMIMATHPTVYALLARFRLHRAWRAEWQNFLLTAADVTVATMVYYATAARPGYAQVLLYCAVALAASRYPYRRAFGITSLVALLLIFAALLPLHVSPPTLASEIIALYVLSYLVGLVSQAEKAVTIAALENARLAQTVLQRNRELGALNGLARALNAETSPHTILQLGLDGITRALGMRNARAFLRSGTEWQIVATTGDSVDWSGAEAAWHSEARRAAKVGRTTVKRRRVSVTWDDEGGDALSVSVPLANYEERLDAIIQVDLAPSVPAMKDAILETLELFCGEVAVALDHAMLRGETHRMAILREKNRIAQELHDTVLQMLFSIGLRLQWCLDRLPVGSDFREPLSEARHLSAQAGSELRGAIFTLSSEIADIGLVAAVERLVNEQGARAGWSVNVLTSGTPPEMSVEVQNTAHRVVREALMNVYKHAGASEVMVSLTFAPMTLTVVAQDNGIGIPNDVCAEYRRPSEHFGLRTLAEQVEGLGGEFIVFNNVDESGATIKAFIPLVAASARAA